MTAGRPLRFLALLVAGWTGARVVLLRGDGMPALPGIRAEAAPAVLRPIVRVAPEPAGAMIATPKSQRPSRTRPSAPTPLQASGSSAAAVPVPPPRPPALALPIREAEGLALAGALAPPVLSGSRRLSGSAWTVLRGGSAEQAFAGGRLGAAQAGIRLVYALGDARRFALAGRVSTPVEGRGREAALGIDWQPTRWPVHIVAEQRLGLDRGVRGGAALSLVGGAGPLPVGAGMRVEGYAQAGVARLGGFVDGAARLARPVARIGPAALDFGAGAWGGAQPGAARLDLGPSAALRIPLADRAMRVTLDWRQRVAGRASPGSGPALGIGTDF